MERARDPLEQRAVEQMVLGVSTRRYARSLEPLPEVVAARGVSKSAVSERVRIRHRAQVGRTDEPRTAGASVGSIC